MAPELYSVEQVAELLGLHVRTVRNYVRDGRLRAVRIGRQYRIAREDLDALTGRPAPIPGRPPEPAARRRAEASSVVHVDDVGPELADRLTTALMAALASREGGSGLVRVECVRDDERRRMTVIVVGGAAATADVLRLLEVLVEGAS